VAEIVGQGTGPWEHDDRQITAAIESGREKLELAIGPIASTGGVNEEDGAGAQRSTVSACAGASGNSSG
jgi:hypothetical protein